jgi:hypothetical protein
VLYVWVTTQVYQSVRGTTFYLLAPFVYRFVPAVVLVSLLAKGLRWTTHRPSVLSSPPIKGLI